MKWYRHTAIGGLLLLFGAVACADLDVLNLDDADTERVLATPGDVEALIGDSYQTWWHANYGPGFQPRAYSQIGAMAFEWSPMAANFGMIQMSMLPREELANNTSDSFFDDYFTNWYRAYAAIKSVNDGLNFIQEGGTLPGGNARGEAFALFVRGLSQGTIALLYDQGLIMTPDVDPIDITGADLVPYTEIMAAAIADLNAVITIAQGNSFTLGSGWIPGVSVDNNMLVQLAHAYQARFLAEVARTPAERDAVPWGQVIDHVDAANIMADFAPVMDNVNWRHVWHVYSSFNGPWDQVNPFIYGMADQSGGYQAWRTTPLGERSGFIFITPDLRFPQGATHEAQVDNPGLYHINKGEAGWVRADRGTWRWSHYWDVREAANLQLNWAGPARELTVPEMNLLKAEGLLRTGDPDGAATLINLTRVANGGLNATDAGATNTDCVPRLADGSCGDLMEMLKWEKRIETVKTRLGSWFFDMRGWGDHAEGTPLHFPMPAEDLNVLQLPVYTHGGVGGSDAAGPGTYDIGGPSF